MSLVLPADREYLTAAEAAAEQLPGFCLSERQIQYTISKGHIATRPRAGRGGGREFSWRDLPDEARAEYLKRYGVEAADDAENDNVLRADQRELRADARRKIVEASQDFVERRGTTLDVGLKAFAKAFAKHTIDLPTWVYAAQSEALPQQVRRWERVMRRNGTAALVDRRGRRAGTSQFDTDGRLRLYIVGKITAMPLVALTGDDGLQAMIRRDLGREIPKRTLQRFVKGWKEKNEPTYKALVHPDAHRSHCKPAFGRRDEDAPFINARWELDATRADAMCTLPDGSPMRVTITSVIDVFTRRAMMMISDNPKASATMALFRRAIMRWGVPKLIKSDNVLCSEGERTTRQRVSGRECCLAN